MAAMMIADDPPVVSVRSLDGDIGTDLDWSRVSAERLFAAAPWRTFRWVHGQRHYSGSHWSSTTGDHVIYESRLELTRLLYADFDVGVTAIVAQPFLLAARIDGQVRRHVPDFLLQTGAGPLVVDVKPAYLLDDPKVAFSLGWARKVVEDRGWSYEVWSEQPPVHLANVRFLAGYRRGCLFDERLVETLRRADLDGVSIGEAIGSVAGWSRPLVRAALLHLIWSQVVKVDLDTVLSAGHRLRRT